MGNICGKQEADPFAGQGRPLGQTPAPPTTAAVPQSGKKKLGGPPQRLGGNQSQDSQDNQDDARSRAAKAAEARAAELDKKKGKLGESLKEQQRKTWPKTLGEASATDQQRGAAAAAQEWRTYN